MPARISSTAPAGARYSTGGVLGCRQGAGVEFAVGRQRQRVDAHHRGRHHVGRQPLGQRGACPGRVCGAGDVTHQALVTGAVLAGDHHRLLHAGDPGQRRLDLTELDAVPADLDLLVGAPQIPQLPIGAPTHQIPGAIHACPGPAERARHKPRPGQPGPAPHTRTPPRRRPHTTHRPPRPAPAATTHPAQTTPPPAPASRSAPPPTPAFSGALDRRIHRRLGRAVSVDHHPPGRPPIHQLGRAGLTAEQQRRRLQTLRRQRPHRRRGLGEHADLFGDQQGVEVVRRARHRLGHDHQPPAVQQRAPDLPHREVERQGMTLRPHLLPPGGRRPATPAAG